MSDYFASLLGHLRDYQVVVDPPFLHGLLTGFATIPKPDPARLYLEISKEQPLSESVRDDLLNAVDLLSKDLSINEFRPLFHADHEDEPKHWLNGYFKAVELHDKQWTELNDRHFKAGAALILLYSMIREDTRRDLRINQPGHEELREAPEMVTDLVQSIYHYFHGSLDSSFDFDDEPWPPDEELVSLPVWSEDDLASLDEQALFALVTTHDDQLPLEVVQECARRADAMVPLLLRHLEDDSNWGSEIRDGDWWGLLHSMFILGLIPGEASAKALLEGFRRVTFDSDNDLSDWVAGYWPALCRNKTGYTTESMRRIAEDNRLGWYPRSNAIECVVADAAERDKTQLEEAIDWLASLCSDESQDPEFRVMAGFTLLDYPRERHRMVMEKLVEIQDANSRLENTYTRDEIDESFSSGYPPESMRFENPWQFYDPDEIERRQRRWLEEDLETERFDPGVWKKVETYVREQPKIGRNEPCPCGSGKKYKKCCLNKLQ